MELDDEYGNGNEASFWIGTRFFTHPSAYESAAGRNGQSLTLMPGPELDCLLSQEYPTHSDIDDGLRSYLSLIAHSRGNVIQTEYELGRCAYKLASSSLFGLHADYIRHQFVYSLLQEDDAGTLLGTTSFLLADARTTERTFEVLNEAGAFTRLVDLIGSLKDEDEEGLHHLLMELLYEMARIQKISLDDLEYVDDNFVCRLFDMIEQVSNDVSDPYHYPVIRVLLVLNEQFMVAAHHPFPSKSAVSLTNKVVKVLSAYGSKYKTFGENIILLLNREDETSLQLLTLKLLYLLFTTPSTYEYFYTNDLRVLVDILVRNLLDLPEEAAALRHTYLRVLYPLLQHTQLQHPPHYKRTEICKLLTILGGGQILEEREDGTTLRSWTYFEEIDDTTKRLVQRCQAVPWLIDPDADPAERTHSPAPDDASSESTSPVSPSKPHPPAVPAPRKLTKRSSSKASTLTVSQFLTPQLENARKSSCSMVEMAAQKERPGVITPSRNPTLKHTLRSNLIQKKEKPPLPQARRSGWTRTKMEHAATETQIAHVELDEPPATNSPQQPKPEDWHGETDEKGSELQGLEPKYSQVPPSPTKVQPRPHVLAQSKKPPPAPKARRWGRGKRLKEEDQDGKSRPPGKFDATLPSINASIDNKPVERSPVLPLLDRSQLPASPEIYMSPVSEQMEQAQKQALDGITETLNRARLEGEQQTHESSDSPSTHRNGTIVHTVVERPAIVVHHVIPPDERTPPSHEASPRPDSLASAEVERSPFLSDAELEDGIDGGDDPK
ncbi:hypothetical protein DV736_g5208, partial [Chaetothyriales sp. CBS 134916]